MKITKVFTFDAAHRLQNHDGKCANLHGHTYRVEVTVEGPILDEPGSPAFGMVLDFSDLKVWWVEEIEDYLDHSTILQQDDPLVFAIRPFTRKVNTFDWPPTAENLAEWIKEEMGRRILDELPAHFVSSVRVYETPTSWAET